MIVVTGGAGFIGSNLVHRLHESGEDDIVVVDDLSQGEKFRNICGVGISDYIDQAAFHQWLAGRDAGTVKAIFHLGACSDTTEWDGRYVMENNYQYSKDLLEYCLAYRISFIYASSAAVYGSSQQFEERIGAERPLNVYGYSKALFDRYVAKRIRTAESQIAGLRYFNVYGPREQHKGRMASIAWHHYNQLKSTGAVRLFEGTDGFENGEQRRDFVYVDDTVNVKQWLLENPAVSGIFNCGTGRAEPFNAVADAAIKHFGRGQVEYIPFPPDLVGAYQSYTQADITSLRAAGYTDSFRTVADGVAEYMAWLDSEEPV